MVMLFIFIFFEHVAGAAWKRETGSFYFISKSWGKNCSSACIQISLYEDFDDKKVGNADVGRGETCLFHKFIL